MIKKIRSKLSVKVFFITLLLVATCCSVTYLCIARFAPYIYSHDIAEPEELAELFATELSIIPQDEMQFFLEYYNETLAERYDDEFVFLLFKSSGEEISLPELIVTDRRIGDFKDTDISNPYPVTLADRAEEYNLRITKNTSKESQVVQALQKSLPILDIVVLLVSAIAAFFYSWYMTAPIKKVSKLSKQMAGMNFNGLCSTTRTDEIGILSDSLNTLSQKLGAVLSDLQEANQKLQADIGKERQLERQRVEFFR